MWAAGTGNDSIVETLLDHRVNVNLKDKVVIEINMMPKNVSGVQIMLLLIDSKCLIRSHGIYITVSNPIFNYVNNVDVCLS